MEEIVLLGFGGHSKSVIDTIERQNEYKIIGALEKKEKREAKYRGYRCIGGDEKLEESMEKSKAMKQKGKDLLASTLQTEETKAVKDVAYIAFACDAGLGSSALGATAFKKRLQKIGIEKTVRNYAIEKVPDEADVIVTHISLLDRARLKFPERRIITIQNFMNDPNLDALFEEISNTAN